MKNKILFKILFPLGQTVRQLFVELSKNKVPLQDKQLVEVVTQV